ncbi:MAG: phenylalanine--tRNA ligase subunit beta [Nitrososphaeraceae archaeon]|nr:phenylalanine--tRNA ligase subunit beta [Nitrososphaeraceae archaeon]
MPIVNLSISRLKKFLPDIDLDKILELLPYVGLDIESVSSEIIRIEYNPNRPDFGSDYGIVRALRGLLEIEIGSPKFTYVAEGKYYVVNIVDESIKSVRPFVAAIVAKNGKLDDETIKQLIGMQEDLHNGIGRLRKKASIGIHNLDNIKFPVTYKTVDEDFSFVPLDRMSSQTIKAILKTSKSGKEYGYILEEKSKNYPVLVDSENNVLSFPPIINSNSTKINKYSKSLFVEVTGTNQKSIEDILAILAITLYDAGFQIQSVSIRNFDGTLYTAKMDPSDISIDPHYINTMLGLDLGINLIVKYLHKSRLNAKEMDKNLIKCTIPRYRTDIFNGIDIVEEVAIGYGIYNLKPTIPYSNLTGDKSSLSRYVDIIRQTMVGLQMLEVTNFSIVSNKVQYGLSGMKSPAKILQVDGTKSEEHQILRDTLLPSLLKTLSHNVHEEYPQKLFEIGKTFHLSDTIAECWKIGAIIAHKNAEYTEIKSVMQALLRTAFGKNAYTKVDTNPIFIAGRCANIVVDEDCIGILGEVTPLAIDSFKVRVPVAAFELNLSQLLSKYRRDLYF